MRIHWPSCFGCARCVEVGDVQARPANSPVVVLTWIFSPLTMYSGTLFAFFVVAAGVMMLRVREPNRPRPFTTPLVWLVGPAAMAGCGLLFVSLGWYTIKLFLIWAAIGIAVYFAYARSRSILAHGERK